MLTKSSPIVEIGASEKKFSWKQNELLYFAKKPL